MPIAWRTDYAMRLMYEAARLGPGAQENVGVLAERAGVPYDFARQIANRLAHEGHLVSKRGSKGGFLLARPAEEITLLDVFKAMDELPTMSLCTHEANSCPRAHDCPLHHGVWLPLDEMIEAQLKAMTLAEAVVRGRGLELAVAPTT
jgi:Rrf2 family protein